MPAFTTSDRSAAPIFILGCPRSGTSMLHWALCQHPELWGSEESDFLRPLADGVATAYRAGTHRGERHWLVRQEVGEDEFYQFMGRGISALYASRAGDSRWVEQTPSYTLCADQIARIFPGAQFLVLSRDGRQVVSSLRSMMQLSHRKACKWWRLYSDAAAGFFEQHASRCLDVRFERLVSDTDAALRRVSEFLAVSHDRRTTTSITERAPINSAPGRQSESSRDKLLPRWHDWTRRQRRVFTRICGDRMRLLGYATDGEDVVPTSPTRGPR